MALVFPGATWSVGLPEAHGFSAERLRAALGGMPGNCVVVHEGEMIHAQGEVSRPMATMSMGKSITALLFGQLWGAGRVGLDEAVPGSDVPGGPLATYRQFLSMRSDYGLRPHEPGGHCSYSNAAVEFYAGHMARTFFGGRSPGEIVQERLWDAVGREDEFRVEGAWSGRGGGFAISARDLARLGVMLLAKGRWGERVVVPEGFVEMLYEAAIPAGLPRHTDVGPAGVGDGEQYNMAAMTARLPGNYSLGFWTNASGEQAGVSRRVIAGLGKYGNKLIVVPEAGLVIAVTARVETWPGYGDYVRAVMGAR